MAGIKAYVHARHEWLGQHRRPAVRASAYRTRDLEKEVNRGNWDLAQLPIMANGSAVYPE
jgi:chitosanase